MKKCTKCFELKPYENFYKKKNGLRSECKVCSKKYSTLFRIKNPNYFKNYEIQNKTTIKQRKAQYWLNNKDKYQKYRNLNKEKLRLYYKNRARQKRQLDINFRLTLSLRSRLNKAIKRQQKAGSFVKDLGCSIEELKQYLQSKFQPGMTWENYGKWHIDHIRPLSSFNLEDRKEFILACNYNNLQPLWAKDNLRKSNKILQEEM